MNEVDLISKYFKKHAVHHADVICGIGDDAAVLQIPSGQDLVVTVDTLNAGIHFPQNTAAFAIGYKAAMVNLSDLAAMGAQPRWATLSLNLPEVEETWLAKFSDGLFNALDKYKVALIGGDTNRGPLSITLQLMGCVPQGKHLSRAKAQVGDWIFVSGELGTAAFALQVLQKNLQLSDIDREQLSIALEYPEAQVNLGLQIRDLATSCIDLSDGLGKDLRQILQASGVGATIDLGQIPINPILKNHLAAAEIYQLAINGGDDYQLCFTLPEQYVHAVMSYMKVGVITAIGKIVCGNELIFRNIAGEMVELAGTGYQHF
jgi:thiamine-monophosphate kinase